LQAAWQIMTLSHAIDISSQLLAQSRLFSPAGSKSPWCVLAMPLFGISTELKEEELEDVKQKTKKIAPECQSADT
jgi:hypothetical protein